MLGKRLAEVLRLPEIKVWAIANSADHRYKEYKVPKITGGHRVISHPAKILKGLQRWVLIDILERLPVHTAAAAYRKGLGIYNHALRHVQNDYLLRMDLADFFPSITDDDIREYIKHNQHNFQNWNSEDIRLFCQIVCRNKRLTIGAPTSPALSNAICFGMDQEIQKLAETYDCAYTRYADDLFFSTRQKNILSQIESQIQPILSALLFPRSLALNTNKTRHSSKKGARRITGLILGSDGKVYVGRKYKRRVRSWIFRYDSLDERTKKQVAGWIAFITGIDKNFMNSLILKFGFDKIQRARYGR